MSNETKPPTDLQGVLELHTACILELSKEITRLYDQMNRIVDMVNRHSDILGGGSGLPPEPLLTIVKTPPEDTAS